MPQKCRRGWSAALGLALAACCASSGCVLTQPCPEVCACPIPRELNKVTMPCYVIEPPDILLIDAVRVVPRPPYRIEPLDALLIQATDVLPTDPIGGLYVVDPDGTVNLGLSYGAVRVVGMTIPQARQAVETHL